LTAHINPEGKGHGAGFWDGDYPEPQGKLLTELSKTFGEFDFEERWAEVASSED